MEKKSSPQYCETQVKKQVRRNIIAFHGLCRLNTQNDTVQNLNYFSLYLNFMHFTHCNCTNFSFSSFFIINRITKFFSAQHTIYPSRSIPPVHVARVKIYWEEHVLSFQDHPLSKRTPQNSEYPTAYTQSDSLLTIPM